MDRLESVQVCMRPFQRRYRHHQRQLCRSHGPIIVHPQHSRPLTSDSRPVLSHSWLSGSTISPRAEPELFACDHWPGWGTGPSTWPPRAMGGTMERREGPGPGSGRQNGATHDGGSFRHRGSAVNGQGEPLETEWERAPILLPARKVPDEKEPHAKHRGLPTHWASCTPLRPRSLWREVTYLTIIAAVVYALSAIVRTVLPEFYKSTFYQHMYMPLDGPARAALAEYARGEGDWAGGCRRLLGDPAEVTPGAGPASDGLPDLSTLPLLRDGALSFGGDPTEWCRGLQSSWDGLRLYAYSAPNTDTGYGNHFQKAYAIEANLIRTILTSRFITKDPKAASLFFVPTAPARIITGMWPLLKAYLITRIWGGNPAFVRRRWARESFADAVVRATPTHLSEHGSDGAYDHLFVSSTDFGCEVGEWAPTRGGASSWCATQMCLAGTDDTGHDGQGAPALVSNWVSIPPAWDVQEERYLLARQLLRGKAASGSASLMAAASLPRSKFAFFAGRLSSDVVTKLGELSCRGALGMEVDSLSPGVAARMAFHPGAITPREYVDGMLDSVFCLSPQGSRGVSPRLAEAVWAGCIPVIIADAYQLPWHRTLDWDAFSVRIPETQCGNVIRTLMAIPEHRIREMQRALASVRPMFAWNDDGIRLGDATHVALVTAHRASLLLRAGSPHVVPDCRPRPRAD